MSGPTYGKLFGGDLFRIENCSPTFVWSSNSQFLAVPQWRGIWRKRQQLLILDIEEKKVYTSRKKFRLLILNSFSDGILSLTESPLRKPQRLNISLNEIKHKVKTSIDLIQGTISQRPQEH